MGLVLLFPNIKIGVNVVFEKILAPTRVRQIVSSKWVNVQTNM